MAQSIQQHGHHVTCALIGMSRKLAAYNYTSSLALWFAQELAVLVVYMAVAVQEVGVVH